MIDYMSLELAEIGYACGYGYYIKLTFTGLSVGLSS